MKCQISYEDLEKRKQILTSVALASGILSSLNNAKGTRDIKKTTGLKRSIYFALKRKPGRYCEDSPFVIPYQDSDKDIKTETFSDQKNDGICNHSM